MKTVRNLKSGNTHTVNDNHFSVTSKDYELVAEKKVAKPRRKRKAAAK